MRLLIILAILLQAFTAALRMELVDWGIKVVTANPSFHKTPLLETGGATLGRCWDRQAPATKEEYGEAYFSHVQAKSTDLMAAHCWDPVNVVSNNRQQHTSIRSSSAASGFGFETWLWRLFGLASSARCPCRRHR